MIFVDSNIPMYLIGAAHPHKLRRAATPGASGRRADSPGDRRRGLAGDPARYTAIRRRDAIQPAFDVLLGLVEEVWPVDRKAVERAKAIVLEREQLPARDALHVALMEQNGVGRIASFDTGFDRIPGVERLTA